MPRLDIQGLRGIAVLAVLADHAGVALFSGGYVGVDVFFVLSGYLITSLLLRETARTGRPSLLGFYARRARRILPAATLVLVAILVFTAFQLSYLRLERVTTDVGWAAAFLANVRFADLGTDYFAEGLPPSPVQHYWSLAVEEQFYLVWPVLLILVVLLARRRRPAGAADGAPAVAPPPWLLASVVGVLCVASFAWSLHLLAASTTSAYFSSPGRAWELGVGVLLAVLGERAAALPTTARWVLAGGGLAAIAVAVVAYDGSTPFPGVAALLPVLGTAAVIAAGIGTDAVGPARVLTVRPLTWVGDVSYSLYLWHWPVLVLWEQSRPGTVGWLETSGLVALSFVLAAASYYLVENPLRRQRWLAARAPRALTLWPAALVLVLVGGLAAHAIGEWRLSRQFDDNRQYLALRAQDRPYDDELRASLRQADAGAPVAFPLTDLSQLDALQKDLWNYEYRCNAGTEASSVRSCPVGDEDSSDLMVVIGDSHLGQLLPALDRIGQEQGLQVLPLIKFGCTPYDVDLVWGGHPYDACTDFRAWAEEQVAELRPDVVVLGGRGLQRNMAVPEERRLGAWRRGVATAVDAVEPYAGRVLVVGDVPPLAVDPLECLTDPDASMATCTTPEPARVREANEATESAATREGATFVPVADLACVAGRCPAVAGGLMVYANGDHLSITWVRHVTPVISERLGLG